MDTSQDLVALFRQQARATPDALAVEDGSTTWNYAQLDTATDLLATRLRRDYGVGRDVLVGVLMGHHAQYVVACLAALKAGGAFLVLEVAYPPGLLADVIGDAQPPVVLTSAEFADKVPASTGRILLERGMTLAEIGGEGEGGMDDSDNSHDRDDSSLDNTPSDLDRLAFVSYSSGSTGRPKGICNPHSAPVRSYALRFGVSDLGPDDRVACNVFFVWEMLRPLLRGAAVVPVPDDASYDPVGLVAFLAQHRITDTLMTPTLLATVLGRYPDLATRLPHLRTLWLNGEVVSVDLARRVVAALAPVRLLNCYSASETHEIAVGDVRELLARLPPDAAVCPVGPPLDPTHTYILDEDGVPVPPGVGGELYVGGGLLARGYLHRDDVTAEVFVPDPFSDAPGARMYRTGDKARLLPESGDLEISGRVGGMIKVRGYTVHPAAVENAIVKHLAVRSCVVLADRDGLDRQLVAYVVRDVDGRAAAGPDRRAPLEINADGLSPPARRLLAAHLAHYMIPVFWVELDTLPTHKVSGKVDVKGLPSPRAGPSPPETPTAESLAQTLWATGAGVGSELGSASASGAAAISSPDSAAVDVADIGRHWAVCLGLDDSTVGGSQPFDFFELGGHSLALAELSGRLSAAYGITVPLLALARTPTLAGHAAAVADAARDAAAAAAAAVDNSLLVAMLEADCTLPDDLVLPSAATMPARISTATDILLTGATGFLGAFLLAELLAATPSTTTLHCLVRSSSAVASTMSGMARLRKHLLALGLWHDRMADRIEIVPGDLAQPGLGLPVAARDALAARLRAGVGAVVHAGAHVNLVYPYDALRDANVGGTREVLRLTAAAGPATTLHYVSTNGVLPPARRAWAETDAPVRTPADAADRLTDGYAQTKWAAEQMVLAAGRSGMPVRVYRPGTLGGHSASGATNPRDVVTALVVESLRIGYAPNVDGWRVEMTPVDVACNTIVRLADAKVKPDVDASAPSSPPVLHVGDPEAVLAKDLFARLADLGYVTEAVDWDEWVARWTEDQSSLRAPSGGAVAPPSVPADDLAPIDILRAGLPSIDFLKLVILLDDAATRRLLPAEVRDVPYHVLNDLDLLATYTRHFYSRGWLAHGPKLTAAAPAAAPQGPLAGRVAVVVGASSGIGSAIATALALDGAHVAVGARRLDALKTLQADIETKCSGVRVLPCAVDVTVASDVDALMATATAALGPIDILVVCAGVMYFTMMASARTDEWLRTVDVNCKGLLHCLGAVVPGMLSRAKPQGAGGRGTSPHIVAVSSDAGRKVFPGLGVYSGSKFFVEAVLQSLRLETAGTGLRVTAVQPGNTATELLGLSTDPEAMEKYGTPTGAEVLSPSDVASAVVYALRQPPHVAVNEVLIEPRDEPI